MHPKGSPNGAVALDCPDARPARLTTAFVATLQPHEIGLWNSISFAWCTKQQNARQFFSSDIQAVLVVDRIASLPDSPLRAVGGRREGGDMKVIQHTSR